MKSWQWVVLGVLLGLAVAGVIFLAVSPPRGTPVILTSIPTPAEIVVQAAGAVASPGIYSMPRQSRVADVVRAAGGFTQDADQSAVNLAARLNDGQRIDIPSLSEHDPSQSGGSATSVGNSSTPGGVITEVIFPIDLNVASQQELENLPTIGPTKAAEIISYRLQHGPFQKIEDIQNVPGIGPSTFDKIKDLIIVFE